MNAILQAENLTKVYQGGVTAIEDISFEIDDGDLTVIIGPSGSGKTTLLNVLALLDRPSFGTVRWHGKDVSTLSEYEASRLRNETFGFVFQFFFLIPELTVLENVCLPLWIKRKKTGDSEVRTRALNLLKEFGLEEKASTEPTRLSGGEKQRVSIARSLAGDPAVIFADEPTGNLDRQAASDLLTLINELNSYRKKTFIVATHNEDFLKIATKIIYLKGGKIVGFKKT